MSREFIVHNAGLLAVQAALVALPGAGIPAWARRFAGSAWALVLPLSLGLVVATIALEPRVADGLTWVALLAIPPGAALALGWAMHGARPWLAVLAVPLLVLAWTAQDELAGQAAGLALAALSCVTLGRLLAGVAPLSWLKLGIVAMAALDAILVFGNDLQQPNAVLTAAVPAEGLPQLQYVALGPANMGYGDLFVAGVLGGILVAEGTRQWPVALLALGLAAAWDLLFLAVDTLPATVPIALALVVSEAARRSRPSFTRPRASPARPSG